MGARAAESIRLVVGSQGAWFACVLGAAHGWPWAGVVATGLWVAAWLRGRARPAADLRYLAGVGALGYAVDSALVAVGAFGFPEHARLGGPSPLWMVALWVGFGTTVRALGPALGSGAAAWLAAVGIGAVAGPVAYTGGVALGAAHFGADAWGSRAVVALAWALALPALVAWERRVR